jgi:hypothetical protein
VPQDQPKSSHEGLRSEPKQGTFYLTHLGNKRGPKGYQEQVTLDRQPPKSLPYI